MQPVEKVAIIEQYKTNVGNFIRFKNAYSHSLFCGHLVNDLSENQVTNVNGFVRLSEDVHSVKKVIPASRKLLHFTLKDKELESSKLPLTVNQYYDEDAEEYKLEGVSGYEVLYEPVYEETERLTVEVPYEVITLGEYEIEEPNNIKNRVIKMKQDGNFYNGKVVQLELDSVVTYDDIVKLLTPEFMLPQVPCKLSSHQMFKIVRQYLIENLDMKENVITSNFDFCFTVKKRVHTKPFVVAESYIASRNKWKERKVTKTEKLVEVFEMTWAGYKGKGGYEGYTCIPELHGDNLEDLSNKLDNYLGSLITALNAKVNECECCGGTGHIVVKGEVK